MQRELEDAIRTRARDACEYCHAPQHLFRENFQIDHIIALQHCGKTILENLCFCCVECNLRKGPNIAGIDPATNDLVRLFHPRNDLWNDHFAWSGGTIVGLTPVGRVRVELLEMNRELRIAVRQSHIDEGIFPPADDRRVDEVTRSSDP